MTRRQTSHTVSPQHHNRISMHSIQSVSCQQTVTSCFSLVFPPFNPPRNLLIKGRPTLIQLPPDSLDPIFLPLRNYINLPLSATARRPIVLIHAPDKRLHAPCAVTGNCVARNGMAVLVEGVLYTETNVAVLVAHDRRSEEAGWEMLDEKMAWPQWVTLALFDERSGGWPGEWMLAGLGLVWLFWRGLYEKNGLYISVCWSEGLVCMLVA